MTGKKDKQTSISTRRGGGRKTEAQGGSGGAAPARPAGSEREPSQVPQNAREDKRPTTEIGAQAPLDEISHLVTRDPKRWM